MTQTDDGLRIARQGTNRVTTWDDREFRAEYLEAGSWHAYPTDPASELYAEGRRVLAALGSLLRRRK